MATCSLCANDIPDGLKRCPLCQTEVATVSPVTADAATAEPVYDLSASDADIPADWRAAAIYTLDTPARCPHCREPIRTVRVLRMTRTQVAFTSTLPRGGRVMACPQCDRILSIELSTFA
jgi:uncharacterized protein with PIN domain